MIYSIPTTIRKLKESYPDISLTEYAIRRLVKSGKIRYLMSGKKVLVVYHSLIRLIEEEKSENKFKQL